MAVGDLIGPIEIGPIAHGGHFVARHEGRVIFVRHGLPGETVMVRITDDRKSSFWRADVDQVLMASPVRVEPPCTVAGICGGCDFQHASLEAQRDFKAAVIREQLQRLAGIDRHVIVEPAPGEIDGLGWRMRMRYFIERGEAGLRKHHSNEFVPLPRHGCLIAHPLSGDPDAIAAAARGCNEVIVATAADGVLRACEKEADDLVLSEHVFDRSFNVWMDGFWQSHKAAPELLTSVVLDMMRPQPNEYILDLYCGVGLFAGALASAGARVLGIEADRRAVELARQNVPEAEFEVGHVDRELRKVRDPIDGVVLDPPRTGAGKAVVTEIAKRRPRRIIYVACDPAALARDIAFFNTAGYGLGRLRAFDLFPMTHHMECVAEFTPAA